LSHHEKGVDLILVSNQNVVRAFWQRGRIQEIVASQHGILALVFWNFSGPSEAEIKAIFALFKLRLNQHSHGTVKSKYCAV
jgi:hypothetical protein